MSEELSCVNHDTFIEDVNSLNNISSNNDCIVASEKNLSDSDADNEIRFTKARPKLKHITQSDSDTDKDNGLKKANTASSPHKSDSDDDDGKGFSKKKRSRIRNFSNSGSESISEDDSVEATRKYDLTRTKIRNKELHDKFKKLKHPKSIPKENSNKSCTEASDGGDTDNSLEGTISCSKKKQKIKKSSSLTLTSICDPDTSDEECNLNVKAQKSKPRSTKLISPKAVRMSAKQAIENMQKIKSESNRMLRQKDVSLPYHRPKALILKDIMNRRTPALTSDGKSLPIKMNNEQLKQYALMLEQRQKEMMELCKSDTDEEEQKCSYGQVPIDNKDNKENSKSNEMLCLVNQKNCGSSDDNDKVYDEININPNLNDSKDYNLNKQDIKEVMATSETLAKECAESADNNQNYHENAGNGIGNILQKQEQTIEISTLHKIPAVLWNGSNECTIDVTKKNNQESEGAIFAKNNELGLNEINKGTEQESQITSLHYDSGRTDVTDFQETIVLKSNNNIEDDILENSTMRNELKNTLSDEFSDDDFTMEELEKIIENSEVNKGTANKPLLDLETTLEMKPILTGSPGTLIDLDESTQKKMTGVEVLKERFKYFARLQSLEDMEKDREKKFKPGIQHLKLKQELEEQIAQQRSLKWEKRVQAENQLKMEINAVDREEFDGEDIEKIEAKLEENEVTDEKEESSSSEEEIEDTDVYDIKDKPRLRNPLIDDEAEVSEDEDVKNEEDLDGDDDNEDDDNENDSENDDDKDSSQSEEEPLQTKCKKSRILKAFEDSDDEDSKTVLVLGNPSLSKGHEIRESQDDEIQLAQLQKTFSDDFFNSQECTQESSNKTDDSKLTDASLEELGFSILKTGTENIADKKDVSSEKLDVIYETQPCSDDNFDTVIGMCTGGFSQNLVTPQAETSQLSQSQEISHNMVELFPEKFSDNSFVSQVDGVVGNKIENAKQDNETPDPKKPADEFIILERVEDSKLTQVRDGENKLLKSILEELDDPEFDSPKPNKYFFNAIKSKGKENTESFENNQFKKKFVIESDDEMVEVTEVADKKKKRKKRKLENRALQISDDEEDLEPEEETYESDVGEDNDRLVEYDSEENEVEIQAKVPKKKRIGKDFFEQEAELTSEDEWIGSGDEDEAGLDRMEREEGDDDTFHQGKLQRELGEIHMREVLDQDKREVRLIQELLFEDGDLGDGHRQRKFRWKNADGEEEIGTNVDEYADTQEDEFESEEQWRKQRHEREMFLRNMQEKDDVDSNVSINRSAFIKAKLTSKLTSNTTSENIPSSENRSGMESHKLHDSAEKKTPNNVPSPKKPFIILQQNYHNSLLTRGRGALARLAALATPLAGDGDDAPKVNASSNRGNFVFAAITPTETGSKVTKRKADTAPDTPRLLKKLKQESKSSRSSLLDHL